MLLAVLVQMLIAVNGCVSLCMSRPACGSDFPGMARFSKLVTV